MDDAALKNPVNDAGDLAAARKPAPPQRRYCQAFRLQVSYLRSQARAGP